MVVMDGLKLTVRLCANHLDMILLVRSLVKLHLKYNSFTSIISTLSVDRLVNHAVPQALSMPVYLHNIVCSARDLTLLECNSTRYSGNINDIQDMIVTCRQRKYNTYVAMWYLRAGKDPAAPRARIYTILVKPA